MRLTRNVIKDPTGTRKPVGYLQSELNPEQLETNPYQRLERDLNPEQPTLLPLDHSGCEKDSVNILQSSMTIATSI